MQDLVPSLRENRTNEGLWNPRDDFALTASARRSETHNAA
jgi:hypothetical protein